MDKDQFLEACREAKPVLTKDGVGILIGDIVFKVEGHPGTGAYTEWLIDALRRGNVGNTPAGGSH